MKSRAVIFLRIQKIGKNFLIRLTKKKRDPENKIRNGRGEITTDITEIQISQNNAMNNYMPMNWKT